MRTQEEINAECEALRVLTPTGQTARQTQNMIGLALEELMYGVDQTSEEWNDLSESEQQVVLDVERWKDGDSDDLPSESFSGLVK